MNYPNGIKTSNNKTVIYGNRGMNLENDLNETNQYYLIHNIAVIYKKPTPIKIVDVSYPSRKEAIINKAFFQIPSTTDYNGIYKGKYIDFEAKETTSCTSFPLANIHEHQIEHLKKINIHQGIAFIIVRFTKLNQTFLLSIEKLVDFMEMSNKKSIPLDYFKNMGFLIKEKYNPRLDYLSIIDKIYFEGETKWKKK